MRLQKKKNESAAPAAAAGGASGDANANAPKPMTFAERRRLTEMIGTLPAENCDMVLQIIQGGIRMEEGCFCIHIFI